MRGDGVFAVFDHDFTKFFLIHSVIFIVNIPTIRKVIAFLCRVEMA